MTCGGASAEACVESPLLEHAQTAVLVECECCNKVLNVALECHGRGVHGSVHGALLGFRHGPWQHGPRQYSPIVDRPRQHSTQQ